MRFVVWNYCATPGPAFTGGFTCKEIIQESKAKEERRVVSLRELLLSSSLVTWPSHCFAKSGVDTGAVTQSLSGGSQKRQAN
jgi:hypothetical protein